jgi:hypothetical protein
MQYVINFVIRLCHGKEITNKQNYISNNFIGLQIREFRYLNPEFGSRYRAACITGTYINIDRASQVLV